MAQDALTAAKNTQYSSDAAAENFDATLTAPPPSDYSMVRRTILDDPDLRLDFHWNEAKADQEAKKIDTKRYIDRSVVPLIEADMQKNQEHIDWLHSRIDDFQNRINQPSVPLRTLAKMDTADALGALFSGLTGGSIGAAAGTAREYEQTINDNAYQNEVQQFGMDQHRADQIVAAAQAELNHSLGRQDQLENMKVQQISHEGDVLHGDIEKERQRFQTASNPGEVEAAAEAVARLDPSQAYSPGAIAEAKKAANIRYDTAQRNFAIDAYRQLDQQILQFGGSSTPEQTAAWQAQADKIEAMTGIPHAPIPGGPTWQAKHGDALLKFQESKLRDYTAKWTREAGIKDTQTANQMAHWEAQADYWRDQIRNGADRNAVMALAKVHSSGLEALQKQKDINTGRIQGIDQQLAKIKDEATTPSQKRAMSRDLYKRRAGLLATASGLDYAIGRIQAQSGADAGQPSGGGATPGAETRMYNGHSYIMGADGQWHKQS